MGGYFAGTDADAADVFDPRSVKPGDVLWSIYWDSDDIPALWFITVEKVEQTGWYKDWRTGKVEEKWLLLSTNNEWDYEYTINPSRAAWAPYFWRSKEEAEAEAYDSIRAAIEGHREEIAQDGSDSEYYEGLIRRLNAALAKPIPVRDP